MRDRNAHGGRLSTQALGKKVCPAAARSVTGGWNQCLSFSALSNGTWFTKEVSADVIESRSADELTPEDGS